MIYTMIYGMGYGHLKRDNNTCGHLRLCHSSMFKQFQG